MREFEDNVRILLAAHSYPGEQLEATHALREVFIDASGVDDQPGEPTTLESGLAISPGEAARRLVDFSRTLVFLRGIREAIEEARQWFGGERVRVLYAGCGPWAPLALPLCTEFLPDEVGFILVDVHGRSIEAVRRLVDALGLGDYILDTVQADATRLTLEEPVHVVVAETMQQALTKEPQLAVTAHLAGQLARGGVFIPEAVRVEATATDLEREFVTAPDGAGPDGSGRLRREIGTLMELTADSAAALVAGAEGGHLAPVRLPVPPLPSTGVFHLMLRTHLTVYGDHRLDDYQSGLTYPKVCLDLGELRSGEVLEFRYRTGSSPGFTVERRNDPAIRAVEPRDHLSILALNLQSEHLLSPMNGDRLGQLLALPGHHRVLEDDGQVAAFVIAIESGTGYDSENYRWFAQARDRFLYVDRVVVAAHLRGRGHARALYDQVFAHARRRGIPEVVCEYNLEPLNEASRAFHASRGFVEVGRRDAGGRMLSLQAARVEAS
jgi:predicted GNAT superfamily acetyltransferase